MVVKENQGHLYRTLQTLLTPPLIGRVATRRAVERDLGHGRIERRELISSEVLAGEYDFPGLVQIYRLERERIAKKTFEAGGGGGVWDQQPHGEGSRARGVAETAARGVEDREPVALRAGRDLRLLTARRCGVGAFRRCWQRCGMWPSG